jgi:hypothetical protein
MKKALNSTLLVLAFLVGHQAISQTLTATANYQTIGYKIALPPSFDDDSTSFVQIRYKELGSNNWLLGFPPARVVSSTGDAFIGSLFYLVPNTGYQLEATIIDSFPVLNTVSLPVIIAKTRQEQSVFPAVNTKWVSPSGSGNAYSEANPGNLKTLLSSGAVTCGTTVIFKGGIYGIGEMALNLNSDCSEALPIVFKAATGETPILDGGIAPALNWIQDTTDSKLYRANLPAEAAYSTLCLLDSTRLYPYPAVNQIVIGPASHPYYLKALNLGKNGFVRDANTVYIKTEAGINPNNAAVTLSRFKSCLTIYGNNKQSHLLFEGITFKNYGKPTVLDFGATIYPCLTLDLRDVNHVTIDNCHFEYNDFSIYFSGKNSYTTIKNCSFKDQTGYLGHAQVKKSNDVYFLPLLGVILPTTFGRTVENSAINMRTTHCTNYVLRNNHFDGLANASTSGFAVNNEVSEADFYYNTLVNCGDGFECDQRWVNLRIWENDVSRVIAAVSLAPPQGGPTYIFRNVFHHFISRENVPDDPYHIGCEPNTTYFSQGLGIKTNAGIQGNADLYVINNTFHTNDTLGYAAYIWKKDWHTMRWINNLFYSGSKHLIYMANAKAETNFQLHSSHDNFYCPNGILLQLKEVHGLFNCHETNNAQEMEGLIQQVTSSNRVSFVQPKQEDPQFADSENNDFQLQPGSPLINQGIQVQGFYDYLGSAPEIGAKEFIPPFGLHPINNDLDLRLYPNPSTGVFEIRSSEPVQSVYVYNVMGEEVYSSKKEVQIDLSRFSNGLYWVKINVAGKMATLKLLKTAQD